jgi:hypothetical protein
VEIGLELPQTAVLSIYVWPVVARVELGAALVAYRLVARKWFYLFAELREDF